MMMNPVARIVEAKDDLGLSEAQLAALEPLSDSLAAATAPLRERMAAARQGGGSRDDARPILEQLSAANRAATEKAMAILNPAQREKARSLLRPRGSGDGGSPR